MKFFTIITSVLAAFFAVAPAVAQQTVVTDITALRVHLTDGSKQQYKFPDEPTMTIDGENMIIKSAGVETSFVRKNVAHMDFGKFETVAMEQVDNDFEFAYVDGNTITLRGAGLTSAAVHDTAGRAAINAKATGNGEIALDLTSLQQGVYILTTNTGESIKFIKK